MGVDSGVDTVGCSGSRTSIDFSWGVPSVGTGLRNTGGTEGPEDATSTVTDSGTAPGVRTGPVSSASRAWRSLKHTADVRDGGRCPWDRTGDCP